MSTAPPTEPPGEPPSGAPDDPAPGGQVEQRPARERFLMAPRVFVPAAAFIVSFVLFAAIFPSAAETGISWLQDSIIDTIGWYYILIVSGFVVFSIVLAVSRFGNIKLGRDGEPAEFSVGAWLAMLFSAGMGIGLVFFGVAEPLGHLTSPRPGAVGAGAAAESGPLWYQQPGNEQAGAEAASQALPQTFVHWGIHAWAIYVVVGLAIAYAVFRKGRPVSIRWALEPVLGRHVRGWLGDLVDILAIVGTLFGVATSLGLGALQIAGGMDILGWINVPEGEQPGNLVLILLIASITLVATLSVVTGIKRGIKWLSQLNVSMAGVLLLFVLIAGPTVFIFREFVQSTGEYLQQLLRLSFDVNAEHGAAGEQWQATWTTFYWGWWISWAPFVGIFIARISRGRTVREFIGGVLVVPTVVSFLWFAALGGTGLYQEVFGDGGLVGEAGPSTVGALFSMLEGLPVASVVITAINVMVIVLIATFFVTSSDSGSFVVDMLASGGDPDPPTWSRVFWAVLEGTVAIALLTLIAGTQGLQALQTAAIIAALPFSIVMIAMCVAIWRQFRQERDEQLRAERKRHTEEVTDNVTQAMIDEGLIEPNGGTRTAAGAGGRPGSRSG